MRQFIFSISSVLLAAVISAPAQPTAPARPSTEPATQLELTRAERWASIAPFFSPPAEFANRMGSYRSVMTFDDGRPVKSREDWEKRREEIRASWDSKLGAWPALLEKPTVEQLAQEHIENFTRYKIRVELAANLKRDCYLLVPDGPGKFPAMVSVFYTAETSANVDPKSGTRAFGYDLAKRGFVTLCLGGVSDNVRQPPETPVQPLMFLAYVAANAHTALAQMPQVDPKRIGIIGHSFGGKWAMFASCLYDKFAAAVWSDPGIVWNEADANANYWEPWYLGVEAGVLRKPGLVTDANPRTGAYKQLIAEHHDLNELHALMAPRPFLVSGGAQDPLDHWIALNNTVALYRFLGCENRIALTHRQGHSPTVDSNEQAYRFLEHFLKDEPE
jgi:hypothetical protein